MRDIMHPDCELVVPDSIPYGGTFQGVDAVIGWFTRELWRWFDEFTSTPEGLIDAGDQIVVPVHVEARAKNGKAMNVHNAWIYEFSEGKLIRGGVPQARIGVVLGLGCLRMCGDVGGYGHQNATGAQ